MNTRHLILLLLFSLGVKIGYLLLSASVSGSSRSISEQYISMAKKNDAYWYEKIAKSGYPEIRNKEDIGFSKGKSFKQSEWAFFPFYPILHMYTMRVFGISYDVSALIWSIFFSALSLFGLYWFGIIFFKDQSLALFNSLLLFCFPFSFYFSVFYTESLFLSILLFCFICIHYKRYFTLTALLIPLTLLRPNGIICLLPLYLYHLEQIGLLKNSKLNWEESLSSNNLIKSLFFISAPLAFIFYCLYQFKMTGFYFAFSIAQDGWYREFMLPVLSFFRKGDFATQFNSVYTILVIVYTIWNRKKLPISLNALIFLSLLLPLCSGSVASMTRFVSVIFPLFFILSPQVYRLKNKYTLALMILGLHFVSFYWWINNNPISY